MEKLKRKLYGQSKDLKRRFAKDTLEEVRAYKRETEEAPLEWKGIAAPASPKMPHMTKLIVGLSLFVAVVLFAALGFLFGWFGGVSSDNLSFNVAGPQSINGGEKASWHVIMQNKNDIALEGVEITFNYPDNSRPVNKKGDLTSPLTEKRYLGHVAAGEYVEEVFEATVFGEQGSVEEAAAILEYRAQGSNAILAKNAPYSFKLITSPIGISLNVPEQSNIGQEILLDITYNSNSAEVIQGLTLEAIYPQGFEFISADPLPSFSNNTWEVKDLAPQQQRIIRVKGKIDGNDLESKLFKLSVGAMDKDGHLVVYGAGVITTTLRKPFLDLSATINNRDEYIAKAGDRLEVKVHWKNNLPVTVKNVVLEIGIEGGGWDKKTVYTGQGFYRGSDNTMIWNSSSNPIFAYLAAGQEGDVSFSLDILKSLPIKQAEDINFSARLQAHMYAGERPQGFDGVDIDGRLFKEVKISSNLQLSSQGYFYSTLMPNDGPLPPQVGQKTTYTLVWSLANWSNDLKNVKVYASLPSYMSWLGRSLPSDEKIAFDELSGKIVWEVGELKAGTGILRPAREIAFQLGLIPSLSQVGGMPVLISDAIAEGDDTFTGVVLRDAKGALTTQLFSDTQIKSGEYQVQNGQ